ncbi:hypothetical protein GTW66_28850 [Streptomyces sp. SID5473]|uniref:hypothetical protein n=1 Tax=Streptomyces TaxID=1883 RepID=UPI00102E7B13|nr:MULTISPECIES: hypothetical protein [Streptomyces]MYS67865.1 hypothetical protein [Streptomyces sp. SID5473]TAI42100.1 hypothetical protein EWI31_24555 [Streptomyces tsukubensis]
MSTPSHASAGNRRHRVVVSVLHPMRALRAGHRKSLKATGFGLVKIFGMFLFFVGFCGWLVSQFAALL